MSTATTVHGGWSPTKELRRRSFGPSALVRAERAKEAAAKLCHGCLTRPAKQYAPLLSPQAVSEARKRGGAVAGVKVQMMADPEHALEYAVHLLGFARSLVSVEDADACMIATLCAEQRDDSAEDIAQSDLLADPDNPEAMREYLCRNEVAQAALHRAHDRVSKRLAEREAES